MDKVVISMGGSVILSEDANVDYFDHLKNLLLKLSKNHKLFLVIGGGSTARNYIKLGRMLNFDEEFLDSIGIDITRTNARLLTNIIGISNKEIPCTTSEAAKMNSKIVVMGGTTPGHSTDMVGAELAEKTKASKFIIATNVDGVFDKDPNKFRDAKQIKEISIDDLIQEYGTEWETAGKNMVIDGPALKIIKKAKIHTFVLNGKKLNQLERAITNQQFNGTIVRI